jgi:hypothetical protein
MSTYFWIPLLVTMSSPTVAAAQIEQAVRGDVDHFGPGFTALSEERVAFRLFRPANVVLFWVTPEGRIDLVFPVRSRDKTQRTAGANAISVREIPSPIQAPVISGAPVSGRAGQFTPTGSNVMTGAAQGDDSLKIAGYWVLLTSEEPITAVDVQRRLSAMSREGGGLAIIERLAPVLVPGGTLWAQYAAAVALR